MTTTKFPLHATAVAAAMHKDPTWAVEVLLSLPMAGRKAISECAAARGASYEGLLRDLTPP